MLTIDWPSTSKYLLVTGRIAVSEIQHRALASSAKHVEALTTQGGGDAVVTDTMRRDKAVKHELNQDSELFSRTNTRE